MTSTVQTSTLSPSDPASMRVDPARASELSQNLTSVLARISSRSSSRTAPVRLVAVSKLKPATDILALHQDSTSTQAAHLHFGENYAQELHQKAELLPRSIRWHFIGALQTNKCAVLASIPNLFCVSSVDNVKKANALERARAQHFPSGGSGQGDGLVDNEGRLGIHVQVNTSGESEKSGCEPIEAASLCRHIKEECRHLRLRGLMTIGAIARSREAGGGGLNEDFVELKRVRDLVVGELGLEEGELELSMGMSEDFENAIDLGSDEVRVGSTIFGQRPPKAEAKVL